MNNQDMFVRFLTFCSIQGSTTGTLKDVDEALDFTVRGLVRPVLTKGKLEDLDSLCEQLATGRLKGRAVLSLDL